MSLPYSGYFRGAEVVGEVNIVVTNEVMRLPWEAFKLNAPDKALPVGISEYPVNIKAVSVNEERAHFNVSL